MNKYEKRGKSFMCISTLKKLQYWWRFNVFSIGSKFSDVDLKQVSVALFTEKPDFGGKCLLKLHFD